MLALRRWNPLRTEEMWPLGEEMDRMFANLWGEMPARTGAMATPGFAPPAEVTTDEGAWHVKMALPGMDPADVHVEVTDNVLRVTGEHKMENEKKGGKTRTEFHYGRFERAFTLPKTVNVEGVTAEFENGMLELTLPMTENVKPRTIEVKRGDTLFAKGLDVVPS